MKISIITINYKDLRGLKKTVQSVVEQTYVDIEYIVIDGNSNDGTKEFLTSQDSNIDYWVSEPDKGIYNAMNKGILKAEGDYLLFLNSGDHFYKSDSLSKINSSMFQFDIISFNVQCVQKNNSFIKKHPKEIDILFLLENTLSHQSTFIKSDLFKEIGYYDESLKVVSDWKFFIDAFIKYNVTYIAVNDVLTTFYLDGLSSTDIGKKLIVSERKSILENHYRLLEGVFDNIKIVESESFRSFETLKNNQYLKKIVFYVIRLFSKF